LLDSGIFVCSIWLEYYCQILKYMIQTFALWSVLKWEMSIFCVIREALGAMAAALAALILLQLGGQNKMVIFCNKRDEFVWINLFSVVPLGFVTSSFSLQIGYLHPGYVKLQRVFSWSTDISSREACLVRVAKVHHGLLGGIWTYSCVRNIVWSSKRAFFIYLHCTCVALF
jgi:hypothetical protein